MGNRTTLAQPPTRASSLRDYRTLTLPAVPYPPHDDDLDVRTWNDARGWGEPDEGPRDALSQGTRETAGPRGGSRKDAHTHTYTRMEAPVAVRRPSPSERLKRAASLKASVRIRNTKVPVWLLANMAIVLVAGLAVALPQLFSADAASACEWHTVVPGDTLGNLGWAHHSSAMALARANHISNPDLIYVGQRLCIPMSSTAQAKSAPAVPSGPSRLPAFTGQTAKGEKSFVQLALPYAVSASKQCAWPVSMILAQWGVEQGWHTPTYTGYNFGNVSAIRGQPSIKGLAVAGSPAAFAYAKTPADGLRFYVTYCHAHYYSGVAPAAAKGGANAAAVAMGRSPWDAGHYTNVGSPGSTLLTAMRVFNLYWYDNPAHQGQAAPAAKAAPAPAKPAPAKAAPAKAAPAKPAPAKVASGGPIGLAPEPCNPHVPASVWTSFNYKNGWTVPPGCYGGVYKVNPANYVHRSGYGWCNWWVEVLRPDEPSLPWGKTLKHSSVPRLGATVFFSPFNQGASAVGHFAHVESIAPNGKWVLVSEMNNSWRGAGFAKVNYRYVKVESGVMFIY